MDGDRTTRWYTGECSGPQWISVDLGANYDINRLHLRWGNVYATAFQVKVSKDGNSWTSLYATNKGEGGISDLIGLSGVGRYVKVFVTQSTSKWGYSLKEIEVYTNDKTKNVAVAPVNLALNKPTTASTTDAKSKSAAAVDGDPDTGWWSGKSGDPQWFTVDLGAGYHITRVTLRWGLAYPLTYTVQVSMDASTWTDLFTATKGEGKIDNLPASAAGRYVRVSMEHPVKQGGYSLKEIEVYGDPFAERSK